MYERCYLNVHSTGIYGVEVLMTQDDSILARILVLGTIFCLAIESRNE